MTSAERNTPPHSTRRRVTGWLLEPELWFLLLLVGCCYGLRLTELTIRGEESRRGRIAWEMADTGDWVVPRIQGGAVFYRPPLQNWLIALLGRSIGQVDALAVRLPTLMALWFTVAIIYGYARTFLSRLGALAAAASFATFAQVLELGRLGETESLFTLFVAGSLLVWKGLLNASAPAPIIWGTGYALMALALLTKGPQAPPYFIAPVCLYLILTRRWRFLCSWSHLFGIALAVAIIAAWQIPFARQVGAVESWKIYFRDVGPRFFNLSLGAVAGHMLAFPLELLAGALLPWSCFFLLFLSRRFRHSLSPVRDDLLFCLVTLLVTFPSVWLTPGASLRYYMPIYPVFALIVGIACDRLAADLSLWESLQKHIDRCWRLLGGLTAGFSVTLLAVSCWDASRSWSQPLWLAIPLFLIGTATACVLCRRSSHPPPWVLRRNLVLVSCFLALLNTTVFLNVRLHISERADREIARLRSVIPPGTTLHSLGIAHHLFLFHLREHVVVLPPADQIAEPPPGAGYFCMTIKHGIVPPLPFHWEHVATINCDRSKLPRPEDQLVVGRATGAPMTALDE